MKDEWSRAYAKQAQADFETWKKLRVTDGVRNIPLCHQLHLLQMACEKLCKAFLVSKTTSLEDLQSSHAYTAKTLHLIAKNFFAHNSSRPLPKCSFRLSLIKNLARQIELLSPAVNDNQKRPDNCEYPWESPTGIIHIPCEYEFPNLNLLNEPGGRELLKLVGKAIQELIDR
jgi:hypothetical protein